MDTPASAPIGDFAGLLALIERLFVAIELERVGPRSLSLSSRGAKLAVLMAGAELPDDFEVALIVGANAPLAEALARVSSARVMVLPLPASALVAEQVIRSALHAALQRRRAAMVDRLLDLSAALVAERDPSTLLELILGEARRITGADAGSIYVAVPPAQTEGSEVSSRSARPTQLRFRFAQNASLPDIRFDEFTVEISESSVVGACVISGEAINLRDCYGDEADRSDKGRSFPHDRSFDRRLGYQTRSMLTVPMRTLEGEVLGAIQLINARTSPNDPRPLRADEDFARRVLPFDAEAERLCRALAAQGAVALDNARLYAEIEALFEGFVRASVKAIEQRDPTTSGHSERVSALTLGLAEVVDGIGEGEFADVRFDRQAMRELEYAALLHDFGKVGVREDVLLKAKKLYPGQRDRVMSRFEHMRTAVKMGLLEARLRGEEAMSEERFRLRLGELLEEIDELQTLVDRANEPSVLDEDCSAGIRALQLRSFRSGSARDIALLEPEEVESLLISRGSLTPAEREEIQSHVVHTLNFLEQIPWGRTLARVPDIAGKHHEYLDGSGYPDGIRAEAIPVQTRMMTIADIFDALTAADRPYKKAVPLERALSILEMEVERGKLDRKLFDAFVGARVYEKITLAHS